jgi:hypothetical protein
MTHYSNDRWFASFVTEEIADISTRSRPGPTIALSRGDAYPNPPTPAHPQLEHAPESAAPVFHFGGDLAEADRKGRRHEYAWAYARYGDEVPNPLELATFQSAALDWASLHSQAGQARHAFVQRLLTVRQCEKPAAIGVMHGQR